MNSAELRKEAGIPERVTREQVAKACEALGFKAAKVVEMMINGEYVHAEVRPQPGWAITVHLKIDGPPTTHLDEIQIFGGN